MEVGAPVLFNGRLYVVDYKYENGNVEVKEYNNTFKKLIVKESELLLVKLSKVKRESIT